MVTKLNEKKRSSYYKKIYTTNKESLKDDSYFKQYYLQCLNRLEILLNGGLPTEEECNPPNRLDFYIQQYMLEVAKHLLTEGTIKLTENNDSGWNEVSTAWHFESLAYFMRIQDALKGIKVRIHGYSILSCMTFAFAFKYDNWLMSIARKCNGLFGTKCIYLDLGPLLGEIQHFFYDLNIFRPDKPLKIINLNKTDFATVETFEGYILSLLDYVLINLNTSSGLSHDNSQWYTLIPTLYAAFKRGQEYCKEKSIQPRATSPLRLPSGDTAELLSHPIMQVSLIDLKSRMASQPKDPLFLKVCDYFEKKSQAYSEYSLD